MAQSPRGIRVALAVVGWFQLVSCLIGAVMGVAFDGAGVPHEWLERTPFTSFAVPGLILGLVVGGVQAIALIAQHGRYRVAPGIHLAAGLVMMGWVFVEIAMMLVWSPLQGVYFVTGCLQVALAALALGAWPRPFFSRTPSSPAPHADARRAPRAQ